MTSAVMVVVGMKYIASVSFGKDSLAMLLRLMEENWPLDIVVFYDTGMEFDCIYKIRDKIRPVLKERGVEYVELKPKIPFLYSMLEKEVNSRQKGTHNCGVEYMDLYSILDRISCWCCCNKNLKELRNIYRYLPNYWQRLKDLQAKIDRPFKGYYKGQAKGIFELEERFSKELVNQS